MKANRKILIVCCVLLLAGFCRQSRAQGYSRPGSNTANFLNLGVSARAEGMGGAYIAMAEGPEAAYYNPSALPWQSEGTHVTLNHLEYFAGIKHEFLAASRSFQGIGTFAAAVTGLYTGEMKVRTPLQQGGTGETFYSTNVQTSLSYARWLTDRVTFGGSVRMISTKLLSGFTEQAVATDIAASYKGDFRHFRFGMMISNLGSEMTFVNESNPLPVKFVFGARMNAVTYGEQRLVFSTSALKPNDGDPQGQLGAEYSFRDLLFLRGGYKLNYDSKTFSLGGGLNFEQGGIGMRLDYGYGAFGKSRLGNVHRIGINLVI